ncbi:MAG: glycosyltransferase family 4 protein [Pseudomonadota bacterium]
MPIEKGRPSNDSRTHTNTPLSTDGITARAGAEEQAQDIALLRRVVARFSFSDYAQLATIAAQRPELGDTDADPEPPGQERLGPRARLSLRPARASYPEGPESVPISRLAAHAASLGQPIPRPNLADPWERARFATAYALRGAEALRSVAPIGTPLAAALNADATDPWSGGPRMSRAIAAAARAEAPELARDGSAAALAAWWVHTFAGDKPLSASLTPPWIIEWLVEIPAEGVGAPFPIGRALLDIHGGSATYRNTYRLKRPGDRVAFVFDLLLHAFDMPTRRLCFNPEATDWFAAPCPNAPGRPSRFEILLGLAAGRGVPHDAAEGAALAHWFRAQACRAFPALGHFASIPEAAWCAADRKVEVIGLATSSTGLGQNLAMSTAAFARAGVPYRVRDRDTGFREVQSPFRGISLRLDPPPPLQTTLATGDDAHTAQLPPADPPAPARSRGSDTSHAHNRPTSAITAPTENATLAGTPVTPQPSATGRANAAPSPHAQDAWATTPQQDQATYSMAAGFASTGWGDHLAPSLRPRRKALLLHLNADEGPQVLCNPLFDRHEDLYAIAYLLWELEAVPEAHRLCLELVDEIWCPSSYVAGIYAPHTSATITTVGKGIDLPPPLPVDRGRLGLPQQAFVFLVTFDFHSSVERKNPLAAVRAFRRAFDGAWGDRAVRLLIKTTPPVRDHWGDPNGMWSAITAAAEEDPRIVIVAEQLPFRELVGLIADADCLVSPHRAEGFGYMPAYALALGRPVIATDYSGTRDFVSEETGYPVAWQPRALAPGESILPVAGAHWADIEVEALARAMRRVRDRPEEARQRALAGQALMRRAYSMDACAARYRAALTAAGVI